MFRIYFIAKLLLLYICLLIGIVSISYANTTSNTRANFSISPLPAILEENLMTTGVWYSGCPVALDDLRLVSVSYYDFSETPHNNGEIVLNKSVAPAALQMFKKLYADKFPFAAIDTLVQFKANWRLAEQRNTTYGFVCIKDSSGNFLNESYGTVITLNPVQNPQLNLIHIMYQKSNLAMLWCKIMHLSEPCEKIETVLKVMVFPPQGMLSVNRGLKLDGMSESVAQTLSESGFSPWVNKKAEEINWKKFMFRADKRKP